MAVGICTFVFILLIVILIILVVLTIFAQKRLIR